MEVSALAWKKESDTAAHHPMVTAPMELVDSAGWPAQLTEHDFANVVWGIISRAATLSAAHTTDYVVKASDLINIAGANWRHWVAVAEKVGFLSRVEADDGRMTWLLVEDSDGLFHIRRRSELQWERDRRQDVSNASLTVPVRLRDGDGCRYCGVVVVWGDQKGVRGGTYDHRSPGQKADGPDDLRVACRSCNSTRRDRPEADQILPPMSAPTQPFYGDKTVALLAEHGYKVPRSSTRRYRAASQEAARRDTASGGIPRQHDTPATPQPAGQREHERPGSRPDHATKARGKREQPAPDRPQAPKERTEERPLSSANGRSANHRPILPIGTLQDPDMPGRDGNGSGARASPPTAKRRSRRGRPRPPQPPPRKETRGQGD